jgi:HAD superfamily hydrolase (TIGR01509 family)
MERAVLFDMDGLMIDTEPIATRAWKQTFRELGYDLSNDLNLKMIGRNVPDSDAIVVEAMGSVFPITLCRAMANERYLKLIDKEGIPLKTGLLELLDFLRTRKVTMAVATSTPRFLAMHKLHSTNLDGWFATIIAGDEVQKGKPSPDLFLAAAGRIGAPPDRCVVLEDSPAGIQAAHDAGMVPIMVPDLVEPDAAIRLLAYAVVPSLHHAQGMIEIILREKIREMVIE